MSDVAVRIVVVAAVALATIAVVWLSRRMQKPSHPPVDLSALQLPSGIVVFTSSECENCPAALEAAAATGASVREVTWELEPNAFEQAGVEGVPLTLVLDERGAVADMLVGVPRQRRLRRALRAAGF